MKYQKKLFYLISIITLLRLAFICFTELGPDEAYYWTYATRLQWNYFDHPPIVAWLIRLTTGNLSYNNDFCVRLGAVLSSAVCTWLIFKLGTLIKNYRTGWFAALLYTSSTYCSITAGSNIMPDAPQMVFWLASLLILIKIFRVSDNMTKANLHWCLFGLLSGLCIMCKVHGIAIWFGAIVYVVAIDRNWLKFRGIYISAIITLIVISPIIIWNINNDFITYKFHSSRVNFEGAGINLARFIKAIIEEIIINNPINFFLICINLVLAFKGRLDIKKNEINLLLFTSLPLIIAVLIFSLFRDTFALWSGPAYSCLLILPAVRLESVTVSHNIPKIIKWSLGYLIFAGLSQILIINYFPGTLSVQKQGVKTGGNDLTLYLYGWKEIGLKFNAIYTKDIEEKVMPVGAPIIITNWSPAATIEFYIASKTKQEIIGIGNIYDLHEYYYTNKFKKQLKHGDDAYFIIPSDSFYYRTSNEVFKRFRSYDKPVIITQYRSGLICRYISVFRLRGYLK